jgi:AcrR family transcriptional regulator
MPPRQTRAEKKAETRERVLKAAERIAVQEGFASITMAGVADAAGLTKGAIYSNFESKEELLLEVVGRLTPGMNLTGEVLDAPDLATLLERAAVALAHAARTRSKQALLAVEFDALALRDAKLRKALVRQTAMDRLAATDPDGDAWVSAHRDEFPIPEEQFFLVVSAMAFGLLVRRLIHGEKDVPDELMTWAFSRFGPDPDRLRPPG